VGARAGEGWYASKRYGNLPGRGTERIRISRHSTQGSKSVQKTRFRVGKPLSEKARKNELTAREKHKVTKRRGGKVKWQGRGIRAGK